MTSKQGKASRDKGSRAERELAKILTAAGFPSTRNARNGISTADIAHPLDDVHLECKWVENISIPAWWKQATGDIAESDRPDRIPVVAFRQSSKPWRVVTTLDHYLELRKNNGV